MLLRTWIKTNGINITKLSTDLEVTRNTIHRYCTGCRMPTAENIEKISKASKGEVKFEDHLEANRQHKAQHAA